MYVCVRELSQLADVLADLSKDEEAFLVAALQKWTNLQIMILRKFQKTKALRKLSIRSPFCFSSFLLFFGTSHLSIRKLCSNVTSA